MPVFGKGKNGRDKKAPTVSPVGVGNNENANPNLTQKSSRKVNGEELSAPKTVGPTKPSAFLPRYYAIDFDNSIVNGHFHTRLQNLLNPAEINYETGESIVISEAAKEKIRSDTRRLLSTPEGRRNKEEQCDLFKQTIENGDKISIVSYTLYPTAIDETLREIVREILKETLSSDQKAAETQVNSYIEKNIVIVGGFPKLTEEELAEVNAVPADKQNDKRNEIFKENYGKKQHIVKAEAERGGKGIQFDKDKKTVLADDSVANQKHASKHGYAEVVPISDPRGTVRGTFIENNDHIKIMAQILAKDKANKQTIASTASVATVITPTPVVAAEKDTAASVKVDEPIVALSEEDKKRNENISTVKRILGEIGSTEETYSRAMDFFEQDDFISKLEKLKGKDSDLKELHSIMLEFRTIGAIAKDVSGKMALAKKEFEGGENKGNLDMYCSAVLSALEGFDGNQYIEYVNRYNVLLEILDKKKDMPLISEFAGRQKLENYKLNTSDIFIMPIQMIPRYVLLCESLRKYHSRIKEPNDPISQRIDVLYLKMKAYADSVNEAKRKSENALSLKVLIKDIDPVFTIKDIPLEYNVKELETNINRSLAIIYEKDGIRLKLVKEKDGYVVLDEYYNSEVIRVSVLADKHTSLSKVEIKFVSDNKRAITAISSQTSLNHVADICDGIIADPILEGSAKVNFETKGKKETQEVVKVRAAHPSFKKHEQVEMGASKKNPGVSIKNISSEFKISDLNKSLVAGYKGTEYTFEVEEWIKKDKILMKDASGKVVMNIKLKKMDSVSDMQKISFEFRGGKEIDSNQMIQKVVGIFRESQTPEQLALQRSIVSGESADKKSELVEALKVAPSSPAPAVATVMPDDPGKLTSAALLPPPPLVPPPPLPRDSLIAHLLKSIQQSRDNLTNLNEGVLGITTENSKASFEERLKVLESDISKNDASIIVDIRERIKTLTTEIDAEIKRQKSLESAHVAVDDEVNMTHIVNHSESVLRPPPNLSELPPPPTFVQNNTDMGSLLPLPPPPVDLTALPPPPVDLTALPPPPVDLVDATEIAPVVAPESELMKAIRVGKELKHVDQDKVDEERAQKPGSEDKKIQNTLLSAMVNRTQGIAGEEDDDDDDDEYDDDWGIDEEAAPNIITDELKAYLKSLEQLLGIVNDNLDKINAIEPAQIQGKHKIETLDKTRAGLQELKAELTKFIGKKEKGKEFVEYVAMQTDLQRGLNLVSPKAKVVPLASELQSTSTLTGNTQNIASDLSRVLGAKKEVDKPKVGRLDLGAQEAGFGKLFERAVEAKANATKASGPKKEKAAIASAQTPTIPVLPENINPTKEDLVAAIKILQEQVVTAVINGTLDPEGKLHMQAGNLKKFMEEVSGVENLDSVTAEGFIVRIKAFDLVKPVVKVLDTPVAVVEPETERLAREERERAALTASTAVSPITIPKQVDVVFDSHIVPQAVDITFPPSVPLPVNPINIQELDDIVSVPSDLGSDKSPDDVEQNLLEAEEKANSLGVKRKKEIEDKKQQERDAELARNEEVAAPLAVPLNTGSDAKDSPPPVPPKKPLMDWVASDIQSAGIDYFKPYIHVIEWLTKSPDFSNPDQLNYFKSDAVMLALIKEENLRKEVSDLLKDPNTSEAIKNAELFQKAILEGYKLLENPGVLPPPPVLKTSSPFPPPPATKTASAVPKSTTPGSIVAARLAELQKQQNPTGSSPAVGSPPAVVNPLSATRAAARDAVAKDLNLLQHGARLAQQNTGKLAGNTGSTSLKSGGPVPAANPVNPTTLMSALIKKTQHDIHDQSLTSHGPNSKFMITDSLARRARAMKQYNKLTCNCNSYEDYVNRSLESFTTYNKGPDKSMEGDYWLLNRKKIQKGMTDFGSVHAGVIFDPNLEKESIRATLQGLERTAPPTPQGHVKIIIHGEHPNPTIERSYNAKDRKAEISIHSTEDKPIFIALDANRAFQPLKIEVPHMGGKPITDFSKINEKDLDFIVKTCAAAKMMKMNVQIDPKYLDLIKQRIEKEQNDNPNGPTPLTDHYNDYLKIQSLDIKKVKAATNDKEDMDLRGLVEEMCDRGKGKKPDNENATSLIPPPHKI